MSWMNSEDLWNQGCILVVEDLMTDAWFSQELQGTLLPAPLMLHAECLCPPQIHMLTSWLPMVLKGGTFGWLGYKDRVSWRESVLLETPESSFVPSTLWGHREKMVIYKPEIGPHWTPNLLTPWSWTFQSSECEKQVLLFINAQSMAIYYSSPNRLKHCLKKYLSPPPVGNTMSSFYRRLWCY